MEKKKCDVCGDTVEGFSKKDVNYRILMHKMKHRKKEEEIIDEEEKGECKE
jgi:hypothetical protein